MRYVYVASSWRNEVHPNVCAALRTSGIDCYDFKNPPEGAGFSWKEVKPLSPFEREQPQVKAKGSDWEHADEYLMMIDHPRAIEGYASDMSAMERATHFVLVLPCGKSAHLELGWAAGFGKHTAILLEDPVEPELMYKMVDLITTDLGEIIDWIKETS